MPFGNWGGMTGIIILVVILLLFGAPKLPALSKSIADSLKIFKKEMKDDDSGSEKAQGSSDDSSSEDDSTSPKS